MHRRRFLKTSAVKASVALGKSPALAHGAYPKTWDDFRRVGAP